MWATAGWHPSDLREQTLTGSEPAHAGLLDYVGGQSARRWWRNAGPHATSAQPNRLATLKVRNQPGDTSILWPVELPESRYLRRAIFALVAISTALLVVIEWALLQNEGMSNESFASVASAAVINLLTSLIAFAVVASVVVWLVPRFERADEVRVVSGRDRSDALEAARRDTKRWWFSGGLGRYNRAVVLPELAERARRTNSRRSVVLLTLDPDHPSVCRTYARMRQGRRTGRSEDWSEESVRMEILATILAAHWCAANEPMLEVEVRFKSTCALTRLEVADSAAIRTSEDPKDSAIIYPVSSPFFALMEEDFRLEREQAKLFIPPTVVPPASDPEALRIWLSSAGINSAAHLSAHQFRQLVEMAESKVDPYA